MTFPGLECKFQIPWLSVTVWTLLNELQIIIPTTNPFDISPVKGAFIKNWSTESSWPVSWMTEKKIFSYYGRFYWGYFTTAGEKTTCDYQSRYPCNSKTFSFPFKNVKGIISREFWYCFCFGPNCAAKNLTATKFLRTDKKCSKWRFKVNS